jgi:hypothetical protein
MYARNNATPRPISVGAVVQISDGAVQTSGASVEVSKDGGAFSAGGGTLAVSNGIHSYTPTQGETDCDSLRINVYKTGCIPATAQAVFSASSSFGYAGTDQSKIANPTAIVSLENTSIKSVTDAGTLTAAYDAAKTAASQTSVDGKPTLVQIEGSTILAKEATSSSILTAIQNLNNLSAKINIFGSPLLEIPDSSSNVYAFTVLVKDDEDKLVNLDASPTIAAANAAGTSRSANLSAVSNPSTGRYTFTYTVASTHAAESLRITVSGTVSTEGRYIEWIGAVVDYDTLTTLLQVKAKTDLIPSDIGSVIVSDSSNREVKVTGSHHVAADIHELQPAVIDNTHFAAGAIDSNALAASAATEIATAVGALTQLVDLTTMIVNDGTANARFSTSALQNAPTGGGGGGTGTGARTVVVTVTLSASPVEGASVRLTKAAETYVGSTNASGQITFNVGDGTWTVAITSPGATFAGASLVVDDDETVSYSLTAISITPSPATQITGYYTCYSHLGVVEAGVSITMQLVGLAQGSVGLALDNRLRTVTSDANGVAQFTNLFPGCRYKVYRGAAENKAWYVILPDTVTGDPVELGSIYGDDE